VLACFASAEAEIVYGSIDELLTEELLDALGEAAERGVTIRLVGVTATVEDRVRAAVPDVQTADPRWVWSEADVGRFLLIDGDRTLVSARPEAAEAGSSETALWADGETNGLVAVLRTVFDGGPDDG
jgi:hypothetical protein